MTSVFYLFRDSPQRRAALALEPGAAARYALYGMDDLAARGHVVRHNLERPASATWARVAGGAWKRGLEAAGGYGGDFATVLSSLRPRAGLTSFSRPSTPSASRSSCSPVRGRCACPSSTSRSACPSGWHGSGRAAWSASTRVRSAPHPRSSPTASTRRRRSEGGLRARGSGASVEFVPFGVDPVAFRPSDEPAKVDVVSVGADPHRDFALLLSVARGMADTTFAS